MTHDSPKKRRRVKTQPVPGSDPTPGTSPNIGHEDHDEPNTSEKNQLQKDLDWYKAQRPPHWGVKR